ncbi:hypothetical protein CJ030_MR4G025764 [Morella rubra]|uniref:Uncharacterized protein n=1 Tax=Morella rubra TaxID=262757 RepID=A0A6A1VV02_9ROSI|nr:hypothetical protein CJ030_MR4G025764 [Morella rubra]
MRRFFVHVRLTCIYSTQIDESALNLEVASVCKSRLSSAFSPFSSAIESEGEEDSRSIQIPHLRDEETPSQSTGKPLSVPLTRSRRLSQLLSGIVEVNDNAVAAVRASRKKACRAELHTRRPQLRSHGDASSKEESPIYQKHSSCNRDCFSHTMRSSSRLQRFGSQGGSTSTPVVIDLTAPKGEGVRCSWGPPGRGGVQFRVSQPPLGIGASDKGKAPVTKSKGAKDKGKKPRWQI